MFYKINEEKLQEIINFKPHPSQQKILKALSKSREVLVCAGRRFGKSLLASYIALKELILPQKRIWIVAPNYETSEIIFNKVVQWIYKIASSGKTVGIKKRPYPIIETAFNSLLECKSAENPVGLLGKATNLVIIDEAAKINEKIWYQFLFPTTHDFSAKVLFISTPMGHNWFFEKYLVLKEKNQAFVFSSKDNPYFSKEEWKRAKKEIPEQIFKQEYLGEFIQEGYGVFQNVDELVNEKVLKEPKSGHFYVIGVDLAKYRDFTVIIVVDKNTHEVVHFKRFREISYPYQKERIVEIAKKYNNAVVFLDSTGVGDPIADDLRRAGISVEDFKFTSSSKEQIIEKLRIFLEQKAIILPPIEVLLDELKAFTIEITLAGKKKYSAPQGYHDDCVIALALAVWGLFSPQPLKIQKRSFSPSFKRTFDYY